MQIVIFLEHYFDFSSMFAWGNKEMSNTLPLHFCINYLNGGSVQRRVICLSRVAIPSLLKYVEMVHNTFTSFRGETLCFWYVL